MTNTYAAPGELDVMADVTGVDRLACCGGWTRAEFNRTSARSISVYRSPE